MTKTTITIFETTRREILRNIFNYAEDVYLYEVPETHISTILAYMDALKSPDAMKQGLKHESIYPAIVFDVSMFDDLDDQNEPFVVRIMDDALTPTTLWLELQRDELGQWQTINPNQPNHYEPRQ